jgi:hypothetical protein
MSKIIEKILTQKGARGARFSKASLAPSSEFAPWS